MAEKFGIENLKKVLSLGVAVGTKVSDALKDGKFDLNEIFTVLPDLMLIPELVKSKDDILAEAKDLSIDEVKELQVTFVGVGSENVVDIVTNSLNLIVSAKNLIEIFQAKKEAAPTAKAKQPKS